MTRRDDIEQTLAAVRGPVERYLRRRMSDADADEVLSETLRVIWTKEDALPQGAEIAWSIGVARKIAANHHRSARRRENLARKIAEASMVETMPADTREVTEALERLESHDRDILRLWAWEGLEPADIAVVEGCTPNTAAARLSRARKRLRRSLEVGNPENV